MDKAYLEITNICNLACSFCHGTSRPPRRMTAEEFDFLTDRLAGKITHLYFHLMGEPLLHPLLPDFVRSAREKGFLPIITTNGTLLGSLISDPSSVGAATGPEAVSRTIGERLIDAAPYKVSISLQSFEGNEAPTDSQSGSEITVSPPAANPALSAYLTDAVRFAKSAGAAGTIVVFRLWNVGGRSSENEAILRFLHDAYPGEWHKTRTGSGLAPKTFLEWGDAFEWPDPSARDHLAAQEASGETNDPGGLFCYALRNQIGVLADGTVVPCCLDADGAMALGNLFESPLDEILASPRARALYDGFTNHRASEELCRRCGYAAVTKNYHGGKASPYADRRTKYMVTTNCEERNRS